MIYRYKKGGPKGTVYLNGEVIPRAIACRTGVHGWVEYVVYQASQLSFVRNGQLVTWKAKGRVAFIKQKQKPIPQHQRARAAAEARAKRGDA
jgi:hypothetical protein